MKTRISQFLILAAALVILFTATGYKHSTVSDSRHTCIDIHFLNAGNQQDHQPQTVYITLKDPAGHIVGPDGLPAHEWIVENGHIELSLLAGAKHSAAKPYRFWIKADAEGFLYNMQEIVVNAGSHMEAHIYLVDLADAGPRLALQ